MPTSLQRVACVLVAGALALAVAPAQERDRPFGASVSPVAPEARVDINHASLDELLKVPGMTQSWAGRIIRFRPYRTKLDLVENGVLPDAVYARIKDYVIAHKDKR